MFFEFIFSYFGATKDVRLAAEQARIDRIKKEQEEEDLRRIEQAENNIPDPRKMLFGMVMQRILGNPMDVDFNFSSERVEHPSFRYKYTWNRKFAYKDKKVCVAVEYNRYTFGQSRYDTDYDSLHIADAYVRDAKGNRLSVGDRDEWIEPLIETFENSYKHQEEIEKNRALAEEKLTAIDQIEAMMNVDEEIASFDSVGLIEQVKDEQCTSDRKLLEDVLGPVTKEKVCE